jgi:hypothetical protein
VVGGVQINSGVLMVTSSITGFTNSVFSIMHLVLDLLESIFPFHLPELSCGGQLTSPAPYWLDSNVWCGWWTLRKYGGPVRKELACWQTLSKL